MKPKFTILFLLLFLFISSVASFANAPKKYIVNPGDNLYRIALNHHVSLESLKSWNQLTSDVIYPGDVLIVSGEEVAEPVKTGTVHQDEKLALAGEEMIVTATAYTAYCEGCSGTTAYGIDLRENPDRKVIAVDPQVIPLGTEVWVEGYGEAIAGDVGSAIKGSRIDVFIPTYDQAMEWGVQEVKLKILN